MERILHVLFLSLVPLLSELIIDGYRAIKLNRKDKHTVTASIRVALICAVGLMSSGPFWTGAFFAFAFHWLFFDYLLNKYVLDQPMWYLGKNFFDRFWRRLPGPVVLGLKIKLFLISAWLFDKPSIY